MGGGVDVRLLPSCLSLYQEASSKYSFMSHWPQADHMATLAARDAVRVLGIPSFIAEAAWENGVRNTCYYSHAPDVDVLVNNGPFIQQWFTI